jgi:leucyl-tRNA---protein transferase
VKRWLQEHAVDYARYAFAYTVFGEWLPGDDLADVWNGGFLPYSADPTEPRHLFYMARSLRLPLARYAPGKQRRYQLRQTPFADWQAVIRPLPAYDSQLGIELRSDAHAWMTARFGAPYLSDARLAYIWHKPWASHLLEVTGPQGRVGWALLAVSGADVHYWFAFYNPAAPAGTSPGQVVLSLFLATARNAGLRYAYLGTCYAPKGRYKVQGLADFAFWDGNQWCADRAALTAAWQRDGAQAAPAP